MDRPTETVLDESTPQADAKEVIPEFLGEKAVEDPLMSEFWACNICTCFNPNYLEECSACMNPRRYSLTHLLTHSLTHLLTHSLTHLLTHSLTS